MTVTSLLQVKQGSVRTKAGLSFKTNADFYPIRREDNLPPLPSVTSSRGPTSDGDPDNVHVLHHL